MQFLQKNLFLGATHDAQRATNSFRVSTLSVERSTLREKMAVPFFIKAFSAPEIDDQAKRSGFSWEEVLKIQVFRLIAT
jgi:CRISPR/Cas system type I-B associated protein Csh2 (Cas7 group RAMP superfamily)